MNKKSKRRAFFVCVVISIFYVAVTFRVPEKLSMTRTSDAHVVPSNSSILPLPNINEVEKSLPPDGAPSCTPVPPALAETTQEVDTRDAVEAPVSSSGVSQPANGHQSGIEPSLLISVPVICYAFGQGWLERDSLIFVRKDAYNNVSWRKPLEILRDHDEEGIRHILSTIGQKRVLEFMKSEGVYPGSDVSADDILAGKGYTVAPGKLIGLYDKYVANTCDEIFPFSLKQIGVARGSKGGFRLTGGREAPRESARAAEPEWMVPNLANLPIRVAVEKLSVYTPNIRVRGNGHVVSQSPRPFERVKGETACVIEGREVTE